jgi:hypothetical protein
VNAVNRPPGVRERCAARFSGRINLTKRTLKRGRIGRPNEACGLLAIFQKYQRRPELHTEGTSEPSTAGVGDSDMTDAVMTRERRFDQRLRAAAMAAPRIAEFEHGRPCEIIDLLARRPARHVVANKAHLTSVADAQKQRHPDRMMLLRLV